MQPPQAQPPNIPVPLKGKIGKDITTSGYAKNSAGKWSWSQSKDSITRSRSAPSLDHAAPSVSHPAKELKVLHSTTSKNIVGSEFRNAGQMYYFHSTPHTPTPHSSLLGLEIWRMESMTAKSIPKEQHGKFYNKDAYIVLYVTSEKSSNHHIHFWIGKDSSQDKYGTAAYKTVELDNKFTGTAIHHREEQGKESTLFKSYFKDGITYLEGGTASSFKHVQREVFAKRLLHLKGRRSVMVKQVEATFKSLNTGDVFVLDVGRTIFQWNGPGASRTERVKGVEVIRNIKDNERGGRATIIVVEYSNDEKLNLNKKAEQFWEALGDKGIIAEGNAAGDDDEFEKQMLAEILLHRINNRNRIYVERDQIKIELVTARPLKKEVLDPHDGYILDATTEVFVWLGKSTSTNQRNFASEFAKKIHSEKVAWAPFVKIVQGAETPMFKEKFDNWKQLFPKNLDYGASSQMLPSFTKRVEYPREEINLDSIISAKPKVRPENALLHAGTGVLKIWKIEDFKKVEIPESQHGIFFSASCYICLYVEVKDQRRSHYIYFWQGRHSSKENKGTSALLAKEMADTIRGKQQQFRIVHNKEPEHFVMLFKGKMIVGMGEHPKSREDLGGLYHIKHNANNWEWHVKAAQVPMTCESLNSNDVFVMVTTDRKCFVWVGIGSSSRERKVGKLVAARLVGDANVGKITTVDEGKEVSFFWPYFPGGKKEYASAEYLKWNSKSPRLFQCSNTTGSFKVEEIFNFTQEDLDIGDPFILDCYAEVYVWVGTGSNEIEKKFAMQTALDFVAKASAIDERDPSTPMYLVTPGEEPLHFKCHFLAWDNDLISDAKKEDEDDGTPLKSSIVFRPSSFNPEPQKPLYAPLKSAPAPDPNRPKISFSYPVPAAQPETSETKHAAAVEPTPIKQSLSFSYPKPTSSSDITAASTTPRTVVYLKSPASPSTPKTNSSSTLVVPTTSATATSDNSNTTATPRSPRTSTQGVSISSVPAVSPIESVPPNESESKTLSSASTPSVPIANEPIASASTASAAIASEPTATAPAATAPTATALPASAPVATVPSSDMLPADDGSIESEPFTPSSQTTGSASESSANETTSPTSFPTGNEPLQGTPTESAVHEGAPAETKALPEQAPIIVSSVHTTKPSPIRPTLSINIGSATDAPAWSVSPSNASPSSHAPTPAPTPTSPPTNVHDEIGASLPTTPGRAISSRPPWIKTKAENAKLMATLIPSVSKSNPSVVAVLSPRSSTPVAPISSSATPATTKSIIITTIRPMSPTPSTPTNTPTTTASTTTTATSVPTAASISAAFLHGASAAVASAASIAAAASITAAISGSSSYSFSSPTIHTPKAQDFQKINPDKGHLKPLGLVQVELAKYNREFYTFEELSARKKPPGVDVTSLEKYLVDEEFFTVFGMTKEKFYQIPVWKRVTLRKDKKLY